MRLLELKQEISRLSVSDRRELNAYLVRLRNESEEGRRTINQRMTEMNQGQTVSLIELEARIRERHSEKL